MTRLSKKALQTIIGTTPDGIIGPMSKQALHRDLSNLTAPALTEADYVAAADRLGVPVNHIKGVRKVEAPRGPYTDDGIPSLLYERHKFRNNTSPPGKFNDSHPALSGAPYGKGGYGTFSQQFNKFASACALDPEAAFRACSWGAFQVLGENATWMGYDSAYDMVKSLTVSEAAHLETFVRYVEKKGLVKALQQCRPGDANSCIPFVRGYNGTGFRAYNYHIKLAQAIK